MLPSTGSVVIVVGMAVVIMVVVAVVVVGVGATVKSPNPMDILPNGSVGVVSVIGIPIDLAPFVDLALFELPLEDLVLLPVLVDLLPLELFFEHF